MIYPIERRKRRTGRKIEPTEDRVNLIIEYYNQDISYKARSSTLRDPTTSRLLIGLSLQQAHHKAP